MSELETERLVLTPWREEDAAALYALASDPDIGPMCGWEPHESVAQSRRVIRAVLSAPETYAIREKGSGAFLGSIGLQTPPEVFPELPITAQRELGYWLGRSCWGQGFMPEAVQALLRHGFAEMGLRAVWCSHYVWNTRSKRVIEKCGFQYQFTKKTTNLLGIENETAFYAIIKKS